MCVRVFYFFVLLFINPALGEFIEADEALLDLALSGGVFLFLRESVIITEAFYQDEFYIRRVHALITDFIALMPLKVVLQVFFSDMPIYFLVFEAQLIFLVFGCICR